MSFGERLSVRAFAAAYNRLRESPEDSADMVKQQESLYLPLGVI